MNARTSIAAVAALALAASLPVTSLATPGSDSAELQRRGGGGGGGRTAQVRNTSHANINSGNRTANRANNANRNTNVNRNNNVNRNVNRNNVNVNRNVNVDVHGGGYYGGGGCYGCDWDHHDHDFGVGLAVGAMTGAVVGAAAASNNSTTVVVAPGSVVTSLPSGCSTVVSGGVTYQQCGSVWYQPRYAGSSVQYVVVGAPM